MKEVRVGLVGYNFMGRAHSNAYRQMPFFFPEVKAKPVMKVLCGRTKDKVEACAEQFGWEQTERRFSRLLERDGFGHVSQAVGAGAEEVSSRAVA